jgi:hypothetical protein
MACMGRRFRFSVRTLAILVTLVCAYFGAWEATKKWGVNNWVVRDNHRPVTKVWPKNEYVMVGESTVFVSSPMPFVVSEDQLGSNGDLVQRKYYLWLFGVVIELK